MNDELALLKAAKKLDQDTWMAIFDTYAPAIYRYVLRLCHDPIQSDNIVGDVFAQVLEKFVTGEGPHTNLRSYLYTIAYHLVVDGARRNHRSAPLEVVIDVPSKVTTVSVQTQIEERVAMEALVSGMTTELTDDQRHVIILRFLEDFSLRETAVTIGKNVNHVKVIQNRAIAKLRKCLDFQFESHGQESPS